VFKVKVGIIGVWLVISKQRNRKVFQTRIDIVYKVRILEK
jgi:hypothetical protein